MGFRRSIQPAALDRLGMAAIIRPFVAEEIAFLARAADPFLCDDPCPNNGMAPHRFIWSCGDLVCPHCEKVAWQ